MESSTNTFSYIRRRNGREQPTESYALWIRRVTRASQINRRTKCSEGGGREKVGLFRSRTYTGGRIAGDARNASNLFVTVGLIQVRHDATTPSPRPSYSNRIFQEPFSITTTVLTKPFPHVKCMRTDSFFFLSLSSLPFRAGHVKVASRISRFQRASAPPRRLQNAPSHPVFVIFPRLRPTSTSSRNFRFVSPPSFLR